MLAIVSVGPPGPPDPGQATPGERPPWLPPEQPLPPPADVPGATWSPPVAPPAGGYPPAYPSPPGYPYAAQAGGPGAPRRNLGLIIAILVIGGILGAALVGYGGIGYVYATSSISNADSALNTAIAHENDLNKTFRGIDTSFRGMSSTNLDVKQARSLIDQFVSTSQGAQGTIASDDGALIAAGAKLTDQQWLTAFSRSRLDRESTRIGHARTALVAAKSITSDYVLDGQFLQAFLDAVADLDTLVTLSQNKDLVGAAAAVQALKTHVDHALPLSTAPGLPSEIHQLMVDFQSLANDFGALFNAAAAGDSAGIDTYTTRIKADAAKFSAFDGTKVNAEITAFYKPMIDTYNSEMAKATS